MLKTRKRENKTKTKKNDFAVVVGNDVASQHQYKSGHNLNDVLPRRPNSCWANVTSKWDHRLNGNNYK